MKKIITLGALTLILGWANAQKKNTPKEPNIPTSYEEVMKSNDSKVVATFIKNNPNHPQTNELKSKLINMISPAPEARFASTRTERTEKYNNTKSSNNKKTAELLTDLLNHDPSSKNAVLMVENKSKCNFTLKFNGPHSYHLEVPAKGKNIIHIVKGTYTLSTNVCNAKYNTIKEIRSNISLALNDR